MFLTLLGGGTVTGGEFDVALQRAPILVAADGGVETALAHGVLPEAVIGDFDSLSARVRDSLSPHRLHHVTEQDSTDFEKCLARVEAPLFLGIGFTGKRRDHELAAYHGLMRFAHRACILIAECDVVCLCPPKLQLKLPRGTRISLFPLARARGTSLGLRWPIDGLEFAPGRRIGTSNITSEDRQRLEISDPHMLLILPVGSLDALIEGLSDAPETWPAQR